MEPTAGIVVAVQAFIDDKGKRHHFLRVINEGMHEDELTQVLRSFVAYRDGVDQAQLKSTMES